MLLLLGLAFLTALAGLVYRFATADGDLTLLRQGAAKRSAVENKVVWIIGASHGIGEALAKEFAQLGAKLILSARRQEELIRVKASLSGPNTPDGVVVLPLDITAGTTQVEDAVKVAESSFNGAGVDYVVHNAAYTRVKSAALDATKEFLKDTFDVNVLGTIQLTCSLVPCMIRRGRGHVVVVSSAAGKVPSPGQAVYAASKHALNGYFHSLRTEVGQQGIKVTVVCPGPIDTSGSESDQTSGGQSEKRMPVARCAELIVIAATHGLKEAWISFHPVLLLLYVIQYAPTVGYALLDKIGPKRIAAHKEGKASYSASLFFARNKKET